MLTYDWMRGKIWKAKLGTGEKLQSLEVLDEGHRHPMDLEMAPDGSLWMLDSGSEWWFNKNGKLLNLLPSSTNRSPEISIEPVAGKDGTFAVKSASDPENEKITVTWWQTKGANEIKLGSGSTVTLPDKSGTEIRAVASDGKSPNAVARIALVKQESVPELTLKLDANPASVEFGQSVAFTVTAGTAPDANKAVVRARYIPAGGHDSAGPRFSTELTTLVTANQCFGCHQIDTNSVGPAYLNVSLKYRGQPDAIDHLKSKVKSGGNGVWGEIPMPPQSALKDEDAGKILHAILGLSEGITETKGTLAGNIVLAPKPASAESGGAWEFSAEAPGFSTAKFRIPAK